MSMIYPWREYVQYHDAALCDPVEPPLKVSIEALLAVTAAAST